MFQSRRSARLLSAVVLGLVLVVPLAGRPAVAPQSVVASDTPNPSSVTLVGSLQDELGCAGDWDPGCVATQLDYGANSDVWRKAFDLPAGDYEYKAALNGSWDENYGGGAVHNGPNIALVLGGATNVRFYYDHQSHWITSSVNSRIVTVPGSFQAALGCSGDWDPSCLRSWLQDIDGDGTYTRTTTAIPAGNYEAKAAINEGWDENYGVGGEHNGPNIAFSVPANGSTVLFSFVSATNLLTINVTPPSGGDGDNNVEWDGLRHDSRDLLYRTPGGAVPGGTPVMIRFRTFHADVTSVKLRVYSVNAGGQSVVDMTRAAEDVSCYQAELESDHSCDFWQATLPNTAADNLWYRFIVTDGSDTDYYADNTPALDGGLGAPTDDPIDFSYALTVFSPGFTSPAWAREAVIYQVFPDRFFNGDKTNDPKTGDVRYDDPVLRLPWGTLPEGYCRNYADAAGNCPWRFDSSPPDWSPDKEGPRGRDYMGGDLAGLKKKLDHLKSIGVTAVYLNPIFDGGSNHGYDTQDYTRIDPYFGTQKNFDELVKEAKKKGITLILDGVFNHMSSDSPIFDRYNHYPTLGACESTTSEYRDWFYFRPQAGGPCAGPSGPNTMTYDGWFGFDSIPVINKNLPAVQQYFLTDASSIAKLWLKRGAGGWRMDVSGDPSFPDGYWESFRNVVKAQDPNALTISETWQKDSTLLRELRGDRFDTTMNYRIRDAVLGLLSPHDNWDSKGFADSGRVISPAEFADRMLSQREDYPDAAYFSLMNLLGGHDTERLLWALTPGPETRAGREFDPANLAEGKRRLQLASLIQFTVPGAPTVYYGDEVGITGDDDPDDRRTFPWPETGGKPDKALEYHYKDLAKLRERSDAFTDGDFEVLYAGSGSDGTLAYGRRTNSGAAIVAINRSNGPRSLSIPVSGFVPDGTEFGEGYGVGVKHKKATASGGVVTLTLPALSGVALTTSKVNLTPPAAPANLRITGEGDATVSLAWDGVAGVTGYNVYRSPLSGGGFVKLNSAPLTGTTFTDTGLVNARAYFYVVSAINAAGIESGWSNEVSAIPHLLIGWANLQWPPTLSHTISVTNRTDNIYGQVWIDGATGAPGQTPGLRGQAGFGPAASAPSENPAWTWVEASFNTDAGNNDEFVASFLPDTTGTFNYVYRYTTTNGANWSYGDLNGPFNGSATPPNPGVMTVNPSGDTTPPAVPTGLHVVSASPAGVQLAWDPVSADPTLYGYEVRRSSTSGGPYTTLALVTGTDYTDANIAEATTYYYVVRSVDTSFNRSAHSAQVSATAELRTVTVNFNVTVPASTDDTGRSVFIAGSINRLDGGLPEWDPAGVSLTRVDATHWTMTFTGKELTQIEYKYTLGDWDHVEKGPGSACAELANRMLILSYGATGSQNVDDTVDNWRNVSPCGN
ncbi:alpha-amylase family glycosyl hydrolase [soil metagenome]